MSLTDLLDELIERGGSDLHLVAGSPPMLRIDGLLTPSGLESEPVGRSEVDGLLTPFLTAAQKAAIAGKQDVHTSVAAAEGGRRFRACLFWERNGLCATLRAVPSAIPALADLFRPEMARILGTLTREPIGMVVVAGLVGSGKDTTVAAMIDDINTHASARILTIEDPIEYVHASKRSLVSQREVGTDVDSHEQGGLCALRADSDVVLIGEVRTPESLRIGLALADTGRLVFATMQAGSVAEALRRMIEAFPDARGTMQAMIARRLVAVAAQRLLPRASARGRAVAVELLLVTPPIRQMIEQGRVDLEAAAEDGRPPMRIGMDDSLLTLYQDGEISYETAWTHLRDRERLGPGPPDANPAFGT